MSGPTKARLDLARAVASRRADGETLAEIGAALGISGSYASELAHDPDGSRSRARKDGYRSPCAGCGRLLGGGDRRAPRRTGYCETCLREQRRVWTPATIVASFRAFHAATGRPPSARDTLCLTAPSQRRECSPERLAELDQYADLIRALPNQSTVHRVMGGWRAALTAAGFPHNPGGTPGHRRPR